MNLSAHARALIHEHCGSATSTYDAHDAVDDELEGEERRDADEDGHAKHGPAAEDEAEQPRAAEEVEQRLRR